MRNIVFVTLAAYLVAGCAYASATRIGGPDSAPVFDVRCTGRQDNCIDKAAELCPSGYETRDSGGYLRAGREFHGYLQIKCKAASAHDE
jgi:hypothetical protein